VPVVVVLVAAGGADEALVIVVPLPPPSLKPIAIPATAAAPSRASAGPFQLTGGHVSGLAGDVARFLGREHQARGRDRPQARLAALTRASADSGAACSRARELRRVAGQTTNFGACKGFRRT